MPACNNINEPYNPTAPPPTTPIAFPTAITAGTSDAIIGTNALNDAINDPFI